MRLETDSGESAGAGGPANTIRPSHASPEAARSTRRGARFAGLRRRRAAAKSQPHEAQRHQGPGRGLGRSGGVEVETSVIVGRTGIGGDVQAGNSTGSLSRNSGNWRSGLTR
jgi:hypothetical protein